MNANAIRESLNSLIDNRSLKLSEEFNPKFTDNYVAISLPGCDRELRLLPSHIEKIFNNQKIDDIPQLFYNDNYGFTFNNYSEYLMKILHKDFYDLGLENDWIADKPLKFKIDEISVEIGTVSDVLILLLEPAFHDEDIFQMEFNRYASIKLYGGNNSEHNDYCVKAQFYLNSYYLKKPDLYTEIWHLSIPDTSYELYSTHSEVEDILKNLKRSRILNRNDLVSVEPLYIYNYACTLNAEKSFIEFYRVLEFFFRSYQLTRISELRYDEDKCESDILDELSTRNEIQFLIKMLQHTTPQSMKNRLVSRGK